MNVLRRTVPVWCAVALLLGSCSGRVQEPPGQAAQLLSVIRARFTAVPLGVAETFHTGPGGLQPQFGASAGAASARVLLPRLATLPVHVEDVKSGVGVDVSLEGARESAPQVVEGYLVYPRAHGSGATMLHRALPTGTEDFLSFEERPRFPSVAYQMAVGKGVSGLRLVADTLEMLDAGGAPRLRVSPPYLVGADGVRTDAVLSVDGCAVDTSPAAPWGRDVIAPGAQTCTVRVSWDDRGVAYPAVLDPRWTTTGSMTTGRQGHTATVLSTGKVLVAGGSNGTSALASAELYDRTTGTWAATASMTGARQLHSATQLNTSSNSTTSGKVLIAGGINGTTSQSTAQLYSATAGTWVAAGNLNAARHGHTATLLADGRVLVAGGLNGTTTLQTAALYNPASGAGSWAATIGPIPPPGQKSHTATLIATSNTQLNNKVLLVGGNNGNGSIASVYLFDPTQSAFSTLSSIPGTAREGHTATALPSGNILVTGGKNGTTGLATSFVYNPSVNMGSWSSAGMMTAARIGHSATLLPSGIVTNGQVLVAGGSGGTSTLSSAELWNGTSTWTATTAMPAPVQGHTATLLTNNSVLVAGGLNGSATVSAAQLYDGSFGLTCTSNSQCASGFCVSGVCCDTACTGTCGACNLAGKLGTCSPLASGTTCRVSAGVCDVAEACNGATTTCPGDGFASNTTTCRASAGTCDVAEKCTGSSATCPADGFASNATTCRASAGTCDVVEKCTGTSATCPVDAFAAATNTCRVSAGVCDVAETCTGTSAACPADAFVSATTTCRASAGVCDVAEKCTGSSAACPADAFSSNTTTCRASAGVCDLAETCTGTSAACPADGFVSATTTCRASAGVCDIAEKCTGTTASCPADGFSPASTTCRASAGVCDVAESCTGSSAACPADGFSPATTTCRASAGVCDVAESCTGTSAGCPPDTFLSAATTCRAAVGVCDVAETCTGTSATCPADGKAANGTTCNDGNACTQTDTCQSGSCTGSNSVTCTASDQCHGVGTCNPSTGTCSNPAKADGTTCSDGNLCTTADACLAGACVGTPKACLAADSCHDQGTCIPATGACTNPPRPCATNHPPKITSEPVVDFIRTTGTGPLQPVSLRAWTPVIYEFFDQPDASWTIDSSGTVATQSVNADASVLISDLTLVNDHMEGTWQVASAADDDFMGFVFGWQDRTHFYLFDWKAFDQNDPTFGFAHRGMSVKVVSADSDLREPDLWPTDGNGTRVRNIFHNDIGWEHFVSYKFLLDVHPGHFTITVQQGSTTLATIDLQDDTYPSGRFGFYNDSQDNVIYSGFHKQTLPTRQYQYDVDAVDPDGNTLVYSLLTAPTGMTIDASTGLISWDTTGAAAGPHDVAVQVSDPSGLIDVQRFTVVVEDNQPPIVDAGPDQQAFGVKFPGIVVLPGSVQDELPVEDPRLEIAWSVVSGPGPVSFTNASLPTTEALFFQPGTYVLQLSANDSLATTNDFVTVTVDSQPSLQGASFSLVASSAGPLQVGTALTLTATLLDSTAHPMAGFPVQFQISGANAQAITVPTDVSGIARFSYAGANPGTDNIQAVALGSASTVTASIAPVSWTPATGGPAAQVTQGWIGAPLHQATVKGSVPITVAAGVTITSGSVEYWPLNQPADVHTLAPSVAGGPGATLATLDSTLLANGPYVIRLNATNSNNQQQASLVAVTVTGDYKPGRSTLAITDFTMPLVGLPITIGRNYDSLERSKVGDFGNGWSLSVGNPRLEVDPAHNVTLTEPGGRRVTFNFTAVSYGSFFSFLFAPVFVPDAGVFGSLTSDGCDLLVVSGGRVDCFLDASPDFMPTTYTYKDAYGREFTMAATGQLRSVKDLNGNQITIGAGGITSSAGGVNVPFVRDGAGRITQITDPSGNPWTYEYDAGGDLVAAVTPGGRHTYTYDGGHLLVRAADPNGHFPASATYDPQGRLATTTDAVGNTTQYSYNVAGRTTTITNPDTGVVTQAFDDRGLLLTETDPLGRTTTRTYDPQRLKTTEKNAANETTQWTYDASGRETSRTDGAGRITRTTYNAFGQVTSGTDAANSTVNIAYDEKFAPASFSDGLGTRATFTSSEQGLPLTITDANGGTLSLAYDARGNKTSSTDRLGRVTTYAYDDMGRVTLVTDPRGGQTHTTYTGLGQVATRQDALGNTTTFTYDGVGNMLTESRAGTTAFRRYTLDAADRVTSIQNFDGTTRGFSYDFRGNKLTETDELGRVTRYEYDHAGQLVKTTFSDGTFTTRTYDVLGRLASSSDERTHTTGYQYEAGCGCSERLTSTTDPLNRTTSATYDVVGRRISTTDAAGRVTQFTYDVRGHLLQTTYADASTTHDGYDAAGRRTSHTDQTGAVTSYGYDAEGQLTSVTDALGHITIYDYDASGNLAGVSDANEHRTTYEYDLMSRKTRRTLPLRQAETFAYDPVGNIAAHVDFRGKTTTYTHDLRDHLLTKVPDPSLGEPTVAFTFNMSGTRATMADASGATAYTYDLRDRLLTKATTAGTLTYTYDASGNVATIRSSNANGTSVDYAWDVANQLASVTDNRVGGITTAAYSATGRPGLLTQPSGVAATYAYDSLDRVTSMLWHKGPAPTFASWAYSYNTRGQRLSSTDVTGRQVAYGYDATARLSSETITGDPRGAVGNGALTYALDSVGNRLSRTSSLAALGAQTLTYDANDELTSDGYDPNGNTTSADGSTYAYDFENRLVSKNSGAVTIIYDGDGNRVAKTVGGATTKYLVDDLNPTAYLQVLEEVGAGGVQAAYTYGTMLVSQTRAGAGTRFYGYDAHGNVTFLTDATGAVTDSYDYDAWGNLVGQTGTTPSTRLYAGEEFDPDLGFVNLRARYYDSRRGRFLAMDTANGDPQRPLSLNRYSYTSGDPVNGRDPLGLFEEGTLIRAVSGVLAAPARAAAAAPEIIETAAGLFIRHRITVFGGALFALGIKGHCVGTRAASWFPISGSAAGDCPDELKNCATEYPGEPLCNAAGSEFKFETPDETMNAWQQSSGKTLTAELPEPTNPDPSTGRDPWCPAGKGQHYNVFSTPEGQRAGSIVCCTCCKDTPAGPFFPINVCKVANPRSGFPVP